MARSRKHKSTVVGAALPLLAPQSFAQGRLERRVPNTKDADFLQKELQQSVFLLVTDRTVWVRNGPIDETTSGSDSGSSDAEPDAGHPTAVAAGGTDVSGGGGSYSAAGNGSPAAGNGSSAAAAATPVATAADGGSAAAAAAAASAAKAAAKAAKTAAARRPNVCLTWFISDELEDWLGLHFDGTRWSFAQDSEASSGEDSGDGDGRSGWSAAPYLLGKECVDLLHFALPVPADLPGLQELADSKGFYQMDMRQAMSELRASDLALAGHAVALASWHELNAFCGRCGSPTESIEAGAKRQCVRESRHRVYPRTDAVAIMMVESADGRHALLGRSHGHRPGMLTCLSGFIDQSESIEEAVRREVMEEAGLRIGPVAIVGSQPWPIGRGGSCELMIGCVAQALSGDLRVDPDEMEDVRWVPRETVAKAVAASAAGDHLARYQGGDKPQPDIGFWLPPPYAIAHNLIREWANRKASWFASRL